MDDHNQDQKYGALVPSGKRVDHPEDLQERKQRELGAAFNRMSSSNDAEAQSAFERARLITREIGVTFDALLKAARDATALQDINSTLGKQLKLVMQENAKYRAMHIPYRIKGRIIEICKRFAKYFLYASPLLLTYILFELGLVSASGAAVLVLLTGLYQSIRGIMRGFTRRILIGSLLLLIGVVAISILTERDLPTVHRRQAELIENMNRDNELGPKAVYIDYPLSNLTRITTIIGIQDSLKITIDGSAAPLTVNCNKYYASDITVPSSERSVAKPPEAPDIFHSIPAATFGSCDLYAKLKDVK